MVTVYGAEYPAFGGADGLGRIQRELTAKQPR